MTRPPQRIQVKRKKGWSLPAGAVYVARPTRWGNPFKVGALTVVWHRPSRREQPVYRDVFLVTDAAHAVRLFAQAMERRPDWYHDSWRPGDVSELRGKDLACWCALDEPCHADVLLRLANVTEA